MGTCFICSRKSIASSLKSSTPVYDNESLNKYITDESRITNFLATIWLQRYHKYVSRVHWKRVACLLLSLFLSLVNFIWFWFFLFCFYVHISLR